MGRNRKPNPKNADLGRKLIKEKNNAKRGRRTTEDSWLHTSDVPDTYDYTTLNLKSITEQTTLDSFLETAELAAVQFTAEKLNVKVVGAGTVTGVLGQNEKIQLKKLQDENRKFVTIPRRPPWNSNTTAEQLSLLERESFLAWRRSLALLQEDQNLLLTPYEKNLDVWRQLWRVIERSDVICQIVDGRNPLLYKCDDLESYVKETNKEKEYIILVNKADYLDVKQRKYWLEYFNKQNTKVLFWSALEESEKSEDSGNEEDGIESFEGNEIKQEAQDFEDGSYIEESIQKEKEVSEKLLELNINEYSDPSIDENIVNDQNEIYQGKFQPENASSCDCGTSNTYSYNLLSRKELLKYFKTFKKIVDKGDKGDFVTVGLVGYPNVGKSSTINALLQEKKTAVSSTPGKTKHFQTLFIDDHLCLCDCPGLVFPSFISTKGDMVLNGVLPIDQLRDYLAPVTILSQCIPRKVLEGTYGINIQKPKEGEDPNRIPTAYEILSSYARMRGFMTANGLPDSTRAARYILKDYVKGKLLYCHPPPGITEDKYVPCKLNDKFQGRLKFIEEKQRAAKYIETLTEVDREFFQEKPPKVHYRVPTGSTLRQMVVTNSDDEEIVINKPWKKENKSKNKNKREKIRRVMDRKIRDLDY